MICLSLKNENKHNVGIEGDIKWIVLRARWRYQRLYARHWMGVYTWKHVPWFLPTQRSLYRHSKLVALAADSSYASMIMWKYLWPSQVNGEMCGWKLCIKINVRCPRSLTLKRNDSQQLANSRWYFNFLQLEFIKAIKQELKTFMWASHDDKAPVVDFSINLHF